jgi:hypothetical protein
MTNSTTLPSYLPVPGYSGYVATIDGRIAKRDGEDLKILSVRLDNGRPVSTVTRNGSRVKASIAKLVDMAYTGVGPGDVTFNDGDQTNCRPDNLAWDPDTLPINPADVDALMPAPGLDGVFVSRGGDVYSTRSLHGDGLMRRLKCSMVNTGYLRIKTVVNGKETYYPVHRMVCEAFNGPSPSPDRNIVCHRNDVKTDNRAENLYWGTEAENSSDAVRNGTATTFRTGTKPPTTVLTEELVREMRSQRAKLRTPYSALGKQYGVDKSTARRICERLLWPNVI